MAEEPVPTAVSMSFSEALGRLDYKGLSGGKIDDAWFSPPTPGDKNQKLLLGPVKLKEITLETLWKSVFATSSTFLKEYHDKRRDSEQVYGKWEFSADKACAIRMFSCITLVDHPRADTPTEFNEAHRIAMIKDAGNGGKQKLLVQFSAQTPNVPFGYSFRVETWMLYEDDGAGNVDVTMYGSCKKMTFAFSAIGAIASPRAIRELKAGYIMLLELVGDRLLKEATELNVAKDEPAAVVEAAPSPLDGAGGSGGMDITGILTAVLCVGVTVLLMLVMFAVRDLEGTVSSERQHLARRTRHASPQHDSRGSRRRDDATVLDDLLRQQGGAADGGSAESQDHTGTPGEQQQQHQHQFSSSNLDDDSDYSYNRGGATAGGRSEGTSWMAIGFGVQSLLVVFGVVYVAFIKS